jgi:alpha-amylase
MFFRNAGAFRFTICPAFPNLTADFMHARVTRLGTWSINICFMKRNMLWAFMAFLTGCGSLQEETVPDVSPKEIPFAWESANVYFMLLDRFHDSNPGRPQPYGRSAEGTGPYRGFMGGNLQGIIQKLDQGYFDSLGVSALWFTPPVEQIHGATDEGTGKTYGYHGYWAHDWTNIDESYGTEADLAELVAKAHERGMRVLLDVVINHTGPVTEVDGEWPDDWARKGPKCTYDNAKNTISCTLVENLPDILTESDAPVEIPAFLAEKWKKEGRYEEEVQELDAFFERTGYPRAPRFYIIKWLTDYVRKYGIDGFRVDTAKHTEPSVWNDLYQEATQALAEWKAEHPEEKLDDLPFFMVGEVYGYSIHHGQEYPYNDEEKVNYFEEGFKGLINFSFVYEASKDYEELFGSYSKLLHHGSLRGFTVMNYISSHDDAHPYDSLRQDPFNAGTKLLLAPGMSQIYYGDETARLLVAKGAIGDANLRTFMNWDELAKNANREGYSIAAVLEHWQKLGQFRREHVAVGAGEHKMLSESPYVFKRHYLASGMADDVVVALGLPAGEQTIDVGSVFPNGTLLKDYYSGKLVRVKKGTVTFSQTSGLLLLGKPAGT